jgi:hypothetical protein
MKSASLFLLPFLARGYTMHVSSVGWVKYDEVKHHTHLKMDM